MQPFSSRDTAIQPRGQAETMTSLQCMQPGQPPSTIIANTIDANSNSVADFGQVGVTKAKHRCRTRSKQEFIILVLALLVLLITCITLAVLYALRVESCEVERAKSGEAERRAESWSRIETERAIHSYAQIMENIDSSVDPCEDFHQYACGGWLKKTYIDDSDVAIFPFKETWQRNRNALKEILKDEQSRTHYSQDLAVIKAFDLYKSCMNLENIEKDGDSNLQGLLKELGVYNMSTTKEDFRWDEVVVKVKRKLNIDLLFWILVDNDLYNTDARRIMIREASMALDYEYYFPTVSPENSSSVVSRRRRTASDIIYKDALFDDAPHDMWSRDQASEEAAVKIKKVRGYYLEYMTDLMSLVYENRTEVQENMKNVLEFETKIVQTQYHPDQMKNLSFIYNVMTIDNLTQITSQFGWLEFFRNLTSEAGYMLDKDEKLIVTSPKMIKEILSIMSNESSTVVSNYIAWRIVSGLLDNLPEKYRDVYTAFRRKAYNTNQTPPRWSTCIDITIKELSVATTVVFAEQGLPDHALHNSERIVTNVKDAFLRMIPEQNWMDEQSKANAIAKVNAMVFYVGYPDNISRTDLLQKAERTFQVLKNNYFVTMLNMRSADFMDNLRTLRKHDGVGYNEIEQLKPNAFYLPDKNIVAFAMGILGKPFFDATKYNSLNFGSLGMVAGHEITHGFDARGHNFDKTGRQSPWMSKSSRANLLNKSSCFQNQIEKLKSQENALSRGLYVVRQLYCDTGGLEMAFEAYKQWRTKNAKENIFPSLNFTHEQLFFLSHAQTWCSKYNEREFKRLFTSTFEISLLHRLELTVKNSRHFAEAFSCPVGSAMNPEAKCSVWNH